MVAKRIILVISLFFCFSVLQGETLHIHGKGQKLNTLLNELAEKNDLLLSFDDEAMSSLELPDNIVFRDISKLFDYLQKNYYIKIDTIGGSFVVSRVSKRNYIYRGKIIDAISQEALPNAEIICDNFRTYSSADGFFTLLSPINGLKNIQIKYLGYIVLDTIISAKRLVEIPMKSKAVEIEGVVVSGRVKSHNINLGSRAGALKLNPEFVEKLPGYGESSMYSFLKLMPGVLATGESVNDISLRGSSEGQNLYIFDNYRVYNPWYRLNEIGTINPLLVKDIQVYKSGADPSIGENVGGVVLLKSIDAIPEKTQGEVFVNNFVANTMLEIPLSRKMALMLSGRKNIKEALRLPDAVEDYVIKNTFDGFANDYQVNVTPRYNLYDGNMKFIYSIDKSKSLSVSGFGSLEKNELDNFVVTDEFHIRNKQIKQNKQYAGAVHYTDYKDSGQGLELTASYSSIQADLKGETRVQFFGKSKKEEVEEQNDNLSFLQEFRMKAKQRTPFRNGSFLDYGLGFTLSKIKEEYKTKDITDSWSNKDWHQLGYVFFNGSLNLSSKWNVSAGGRMNYSRNVRKLFVEPRIAMNYYPNHRWKIYGAYGIFQQFTYKANISDKLQNISYRIVNVGDNIPVFQLNDLCLGMRYHRNRWTLSAELFYKYTNERIRAVNASAVASSINDKAVHIIAEKVRYVGADFFLKYQHNGFMSWVSFTVSDYGIDSPQNTSKRNSSSQVVSDANSKGNILRFGFEKTNFSRSSYDMKREFKWAATYTWKKFSLSASYVYGSGFMMWHKPSFVGAPDYNRFDMGIFYKRKLWDTDVELGFSLLNVFNHKNKRLDEFSRFGVGDNLVSYNTYGLSITPAFFVKIKF